MAFRWIFFQLDFSQNSLWKFQSGTWRDEECLTSGIALELFVWKWYTKNAPTYRSSASYAASSRHPVLLDSREYIFKRSDHQAPGLVPVWPSSLCVQTFRPSHRHCPSGRHTVHSVWTVRCSNCYRKHPPHTNSSRAVSIGDHRCIWITLRMKRTQTGRRSNTRVQTAFCVKNAEWWIKKCGRS